MRKSVTDYTFCCRWILTKEAWQILVLLRHDRNGCVAVFVLVDDKTERTLENITVKLLIKMQIARLETVGNQQDAV